MAGRVQRRVSMPSTEPTASHVAAEISDLLTSRQGDQRYPKRLKRERAWKLERLRTGRGRCVGGSLRQRPGDIIGLERGKGRGTDAEREMADEGGVRGREREGARRGEGGGGGGEKRRREGRGRGCGSGLPGRKGVNDTKKRK